MLRPCVVVFCLVRQISFLNQVVFGKGHVPFSPSALDPRPPQGGGVAPTARNRQGAR